MQISNMLGQYQRNITGNSTEELKGVSGMQKLVSTVEQLSAGNIFEGTVHSVRGGRVMLALSNGQLINAHLDGKVSLQVGSPMFFQVKSNEGGIVSIRPYLGDGNTGNPILMNALTTAGIPVNARNLSMVEFMMREQMPIDKQSVNNMARLIGMNPETSVQTLVEMTKLGIPATNEMAAQFENYKGDGKAILNEMNLAIDQLTELLGSEGLSPEDSVKLNQKVLDVLLEKYGQPPKEQLPEEQMKDAQALKPEYGSTEAADIVKGEQQETNTGVQQQNGTGEVQESAKAGSTFMQAAEGEAVELKAGGMRLHQVLNPEQLENLTKLLQKMPTLLEQPELFKTAGEDIFIDTMQEDGKLLPGEGGETVNPEQHPQLDSEASVETFLKLVQQGLMEQENFGFAGVKKLLASKEYQTLLKSVMEEQWLVRPEELKTENKVNELYERLEHQMKQLENVIKAAGLEQTSFSQTAADVTNNIEFMNQINQIYTYVQLPLKLSGKNANADLYVYTNKKSLNNPDAELTAFLHLDLDYLGPTDVSVRMQHKHVKTNFYFSDDESYALVKAYLPVLEEKLKKKGYSCVFSVENEEKKVDFVEDFLRRDLPTAGTLHRYSFDVRM